MIQLILSLHLIAQRFIRTWKWSRYPWSSFWAL